MNKPYRQFIAQSLKQNSRQISSTWLDRLVHVVQEDEQDIFPTELYLDHIPSLIEEIGIVTSDEDFELAMVNSVISHKALELGTLRHEQQATVSQLLREYDLLAHVLDDFLCAETAKFVGSVTVQDALNISESIGAVIRLILQYTVDAFAERYMATIEEQTEKLASFNQLLSHEMRSPLNSALLSVDLLIDTVAVDTSVHSDIEDVRKSLIAACSVLENLELIVDDSQHALQDDPVSQTIALTPLLTDLTSQLQTSLNERQIDIQIPDDLGELTVEIGKLKLIINNVLSNAIKYSDLDKKSRTIEILRVDYPDGKVMLTIRDNGLGIPEEQLKQVLRIRVRAHQALDDQNGVGGHGLGLYLVEKAIRTLGGSIDLQSTPGEGTAVNLIFPHRPDIV